VFGDDGVRARAVARVWAAISAAVFELRGEVDWALAGPTATRERFVLARLPLLSEPPMSA
jgi:hypothetical protein